MFDLLWDWSCGRSKVLISGNLLIYILDFLFNKFSGLLVLGSIVLICQLMGFGSGKLLIGIVLDSVVNFLSL